MCLRVCARMYVRLCVCECLYVHASVCAPACVYMCVRMPVCVYMMHTLFLSRCNSHPSFFPSPFTISPSPLPSPSFLLSCVTFDLSHPPPKSPRHQLYLVHEPPEVHPILHLAQLPLADPENPSCGPPPPFAGPVPLLRPRLPGQEAAGSVRRKPNW